MRRFQSLCGAVVWRITTRGFTLQEVLILDAMSIAISTLRAEKRGQGTLAEQGKNKYACNLENS
jgi:hypothetical protein